MHMRLFPRLRTRWLWAAVLVAAVFGFAGRPWANDEVSGAEPENPAVIKLLHGLPTPAAVQFPWQAGRFSQFQIGAEEEQYATARSGTLAGELYRAPLPGPAPYAVLLSGCGGTYPGVNGLWLKLWARALQDIGVGALALDSFDVRGVKDGVCGDDAKIWAQRRVDDAYSALAWLASQPFVDGRRIVIMGMSNGARVALLSLSAQENWRFQRFAAAVAFYPVCDRLPRHELLGPALMLLGEADEGAPPKDCEAFAEKRRGVSFPPHIKAYPHAGHLFDVYPRDENYDVPEVVESRMDTLAFLRRAIGLAQPATQHAAAP